MTNEEIADKLEIYNKWRRGEPPFDSSICKLPIEPKELGLLIDVAIVKLRMKQGEKKMSKNTKKR